VIAVNVFSWLCESEDVKRTTPTAAIDCVIVQVRSISANYRRDVACDLQQKQPLSCDDLAPYSLIFYYY